MDLPETSFRLLTRNTIFSNPLQSPLPIAAKQSAHGSEVGAQQVPVFPPAHREQLLLAHGEGEVSRGNLSARIGQANRNEPVASPGLFVGRAELQ
jgi:hypothetical protein